jgi:hypothetical protein
MTDQLDMLLCMLPSEETFLWGRRGDRVPLEDMPDTFYDFCKERAEELRAQILSSGEAEGTSRASAPSPNHPCWLGP